MSVVERESQVANYWKTDFHCLGVSIYLSNKSMKTASDLIFMIYGKIMRNHMRTRILSASFSFKEHAQTTNIIHLYICIAIP